MNADFIEYYKDARRTFVNKFMKTYPTAKEREIVTDLLIAYYELMQWHEEMREVLIESYEHMNGYLEYRETVNKIEKILDL